MTSTEVCNINLSEANYLEKMQILAKCRAEAFSCKYLLGEGERSERVRPVCKILRILRIHAGGLKSILGF